AILGQVEPLLERERGDSAPPPRATSIVLVDTSVWVDHLRNGNAALASRLESEEVRAAFGQSPVIPCAANFESASKCALKSGFFTDQKPGSDHPRALISGAEIGDVALVRRGWVDRPGKQ
ncbi:MAG: hypothetical protein V3T72_12285, partial [Thermoanaerobaculia bacterium]